MSSRLEYAKLFSSYGWVPIMVNGKKPIQKGWPNAKSEDTIALLSKSGDSKDLKLPSQNIGILTGSPSKIVVVDIDVKSNGLAKWESLTKQNGDPNTFKVSTGGGGLHYYFNYDKRMYPLHNGIVRDMSIDFKTTGGQVVAPGSIHPDSKKQYCVISGVTDNKPQISDMPEWLYLLIKSNQ